ncbi:MAG: dihydropteroate synthase [Chloroflexi bacterium]|nr:dihydropteroate synthase [Chloroflexota bacterium]
MKIGGATFEWGARTYVMGVLNITPDSFSGDGLRPENEAAIEAAVEQAVRFEREGAHILDIGGESTRPPGVYDGARSVGVQEELERVLPVIEAVRAACSLPVSIDTRKAAVARAAVDAGAGLVNDVTMLGYDPEMMETIADLGTPIVISHIRARARYDDVVGEVITDLIATVNEAEKAGVKRDRIILDPGIGFGKTAAHSLEVLRHLDELTQLGFPTLIGTSRKSSIGLVLDLPVDDRVEGTAATVALAIASGADMVRVHDVKVMARVAKMSDAIVRGWEGPQTP